MDSKMGEWEQNNLMNELVQGKELAKLLQSQLKNGPLSSSSSSPSSSFSPSSYDQEARGKLVQKIISSYDKALSMLNFSSSPSSAIQGLVIESPPSLSGSPRSDQDSDRDVKDSLELNDGSKKRSKTFPRWTHKVRVSTGAGLEGALDDGFSWRKYGQKDILGAKYPRGYYRCTHRKGKDCMATKQVQRSDEDPTIIEITYRGNHTCSSQEPNQINTTTEPQQPNFSYQTQPPEQALLNLKQDLEIVTQDLDTNPQQLSPFPPFHFPSTSPSMVISSDFTGNFSHSFIISPQASGSTDNYNFSASPPSGMINNFLGNQTELNVVATSATNSPTVGLDFPFGDIECDPNFTFDNLGLFSPFQQFEKHSK